LAQLKYNILLMKKIKGGIWGDFGKWKGGWRQIVGLGYRFQYFSKDALIFSKDTVAIAKIKVKQ